MWKCADYQALRHFPPAVGGRQPPRNRLARCGESRLVAASAFASALALRLMALGSLRTPTLPRIRARVYDRDRVAGVSSN